MLNKVRDVFRHNPAKVKTPWISICLTGLISFFQAVQFSLFFSSMWPYMQLVDITSTETFFGLVVGSYSFGQMIFGPLFGVWSHKIRSIEKPALVCQISLLMGNLIYLFAPILPSNRKYAILVARVFVGIGESSLSLMQSYASTASLEKDRSRAIAINTGGLALGICIGPLFQIFFIPIGYPGVHLFGDIYLSMYTTPALFCCCINLISMVLLFFVFEENYVGIHHSESEHNTLTKLPPYDKLAVVLCHATKFMQLFVFTNLETLGAPFFMAMFALSRKETVETMAITHGISGLVATLVYAIYIVYKPGPKYNYRYGIFVAIFLYLVFHLSTFSYPNDEHVQYYTDNEYSLYLNGTLKEEPTGCAVDAMTWCQSISPINFWVYVFNFAVVLAIAFSLMNVHISTTFSKIIGPRQQTHEQAMNQASGSFARLLGPILISNLYTNFGPRAAWIAEYVVIGVMLIFWAFMYKRMVPLQIQKNPEKIHTITIRRESEVYDQKIVL